MGTLFKDNAKLSATLIGSVVGAGFLSGAELVRFFPSENFLPWAAYAAALFFVCFWLLSRCGAAFGGFDGALFAAFGRAESLFRAVMLASALVLCAAMLAGLDAAVWEGFGVHYAFPFAAALAMPLVCLFARRGTGGAAAFNLLLVPFILLFLLAAAKNGDYAGTDYAMKSVPHAFFSVTLYVAMNVFLAAPVVCDAGAARRQGDGIPACAVAAFVLGGGIAIVLANVARAGGAGAELPFLAAATGEGWRRAFTAVCLCGILTSLFSAYYPLHACVSGRKKAALFRAAFALCAFALSFAGLRGLVEYAYPVIGGAGAVLLAALVFAQIKSASRASSRRARRAHTSPRQARRG